ncbi:MAG: hypothetical protein KJ630_22895 [Proteobacteria bacterium]|nr:hypothetical protein [Pseudomonadota bacterium]
MSDTIKIIPVGILLGLIFFIGCSRLPTYSQPRVETGDVFRFSQVISYRELTTNDFHATALPEDLRSHGHELNAHTSVAIRSLPGAKFDFSLQGNGDGQLWCGHAENLVFEAVMLPEKSWWNSTLAKDQEAYVLQHEQIHFALMEVAARHLNLRATKEQDQLVSCAADLEAGKTKISVIVDQWMEELQEETLKQHGEFDEATSRLYAPKVQQGWFDRVMRELQYLSDLK